MAITSGVGMHQAWLNVNGTSLLIEGGTVTQSAKRKTAQFHCAIPITEEAYDTFATISGDSDASITALTRGVRAPLITGHLLKVRVDAIGRIIQVTGEDKSGKLHRIKSSEKWLNKTPSEIVQDLIGRAGISAGNIASSSIMAGKKVVQDFVKLSDNVSAGYIIHKLSQLDGARWWVDPEGKFHYAPIGTPSGIYSIFIDQSSQPIVSDCLDLNITRNIEAAKEIRVKVKAWHPRKKQIFESEAKIPGNGGPLEYNFHIPNLQQDHVTKYAQSMAAERARHELTVSATVVGDPTVFAGMQLQLSGTGYFDQLYDIDHVQHTVGMQGHRTHMTARSARRGRAVS